MKGFLDPKTIAVVGASSDRQKVGFSLMFNLRKFKGDIIPINLKGKHILGKKCYKTVLDYPKKIDLALIAVPAPVVPYVLKQCIDKGIPNVIIISSGFSEIGNKDVEEKLKEMAKGKAKILGPNCIAGDSSILITNDNKIKYKQIGPLIDELMDKHKKQVINIFGTYVLDLKHHDKELNIVSYHKGRVVKRRLTKVMKRVSDKSLKITCDGGHELICSEDHPVLIKKNGELTKVDASSLKGGELIPILRDLNFNRDKNLTHINLINEFKNLPGDIRKNIRVKFKNKAYLFDKFVGLKGYDIREAGLCVAREQITLPGLLEISGELCKLLGFFIADGNYKSNCLRIGYVNCRDAEKELRKCINKVFDSKLVDLSNCKDIKFGRGIGRILFKYVFKIGEGALNKTIPDFIFNTSEQNMTAFLSGLYSGDGCIYLYKNKIKATLTITSVSKTLIDQLGYLFALLNTGPFYKRVRYIDDDYKIKGKSCKANKQYILRTDSFQVIKRLYRKDFRFLVKNKNNLLNMIVSRGYNFPSREGEQIYYRKIRSIEHTKDVLDLYDFEVEDSHNFVANQILTSNCFGVVNPYNNLNTTFAVQTPKKGDVAFVSQSGSLWSAILEYSIRTHFGFSGFVSFGNMIDVDFADCIDYFDKDPKTKVIVIYIEALHDGKKFMRAAKRCQKPIIAIKSGSSEAGKKATFSHTGSMAGTFEVYKTVFKQCGVIHVGTLTEAFDKAKFFQTIDGKRVVIITNSGGPGALVADYCEKEGLEVVSLPKNLVFNLHPAWSHNNPIDVVGDAKSDSYKNVFDVLTENRDFYDCVIVILTPQKMTDVVNVANEVVKFKRNSKKPVSAAWMTEVGKDFLEKAKIPAFFKLERAAKAFITKKQQFKPKSL